MSRILSLIELTANKIRIARLMVLKQAWLEPQKKQQKNNNTSNVILTKLYVISRIFFAVNSIKESIRLMVSLLFVHFGTFI